MGRTVAVMWHASFSVAAGVLYFFFVLPRTYELLGDTSHTLGTALRIVTGALIGLAALPVVFTLLRTRRPEFGTPKLALNLRTASIVLHVLAGLLIVGTAISEIWLSLDAAGQWLFGIYGAAAAIALLGVLSFYLAFAAELPPPPPKPVKVKQRKSRRRRKGGDTTHDQSEEAADEGSEGDTDQVDGVPDTTDDTAAAAETENAGTETQADRADEETADETVPTAESEPAAETEDSDAGTDEASDGKLRNQRPTGKRTVLGRRKKNRGGVAVED
ncbi:hypothetical protein Mycch_4867 [Mycolicibacterium chubuense NBB4]|uniref:Transmembrane protein n=1 Tax=Mycolicibacterium chubuense (strain NBB4) TaxID=710421 RepID=I4BQK3_MYCCN|nr:hypothetical protein [Mycolicibacterium chubuense]AFM19560.1 hypothetical protein Mycch_4867 [Mycolicibacterium chubuense NBB4]